MNVSDFSAFEYTSPAQQVVFGAGSLDRLGALVEGRHWQRLLLCTSGSYRRSGRVTQVQSVLGGRLAATFDEVQPHVPDFQVAQALALAAENEIDAIIGLGGGSPIGMAKAISQSVADRRAGQSAPAAISPDLFRVPVIAVPTTYAGSEMTPVYGVTHHTDGTTRKVTVTDPRVTPTLVLYDPQLTLDLPPELTASTGINALAHCVEAIYSITRNPLSTAAALEGARHLAEALPRAFAAGQDLAARGELQTGSYLAGVALASVAMGLHHGLCHVLGGTAGVPHGIANAIILPHAIDYNADACAPALARLAQGVGMAQGENDDTGQTRRLAAWVRDLTTRLNLPRRLRDVGVKESDLPHLAQLAASSRTVQNNPKPAAASDLLTILQAAW